MAFPTSPLGVTAELYLGASLGWVDVTSDVRLSSASSGGGLSITRGKQNESGQVDPGRCSATFNNASGKYSPRNPLSPYYGVLGRNTPFRLAVGTLASDGFARTVANGWGTADSGQTWATYNGTAAEYFTSAGVATHRFAAVANATRAAYLTGLPLVDVEYVYDVTLPVAPVGAPIVTGALTRFAVNADGTWVGYWLRCEFNPDGTVGAKVSRGNPSAGTIPTAYVTIGQLATIPGLTYSAGQTYRVRVASIGPWHAVKVWQASATEPADWTVAAGDATYGAAGAVGHMTWLLSGSTMTAPVDVRYANVKAVDRRFHGEVSTWPNRWDLSGNDRWVPVEASGILRRLQQGAAPLRSPMYRNLNQYGPVAWLPLEDGSQATAPSSGAASRPAGTAVDVTYGSATAPAGAASAVQMNSAGSSIFMPVTYGGTSSEWTTAFHVRLPNGWPAASTPVAEITTVGGTATRWVVQLGNGTFSLDGYNAAGTSISSTFSLWSGSGPAVGWALFVLRVKASGGTVTPTVTLYTAGDSTSYTADEPTFSGTVGSVVSVKLTPGTINQPVFSHLFVTNQPIIATATNFTQAMGGYAGELATDRVKRLAAEEGVSVAVAGVADQAMGPQQVATFLQNLESAAAVDGGLLVEARAGLGLLFRPLNTLYGQTPTTADYGAGQISEPFEPLDDDSMTANDITVTRTTGGSARATLAAGPLSTQPPPNGVGVYAMTVDLNTATDTRLVDQAGWRLFLGTRDEARYPRVHVNLAASAWASDPLHTAQATAVDTGDTVRLANLPADLAVGTALVRVDGYTETLDAFAWDIVWNAAPGSVWNVASADGDPRVPADGSTLTAGITASASSLQITSTASNGPWTTALTDFPLDITCGGEQIRLGAPGQVLNANPWLLVDASGWVGSNATAPRSTVQQFYPDYGSLFVTPDGVGTSGGANATTRVAATAGAQYRAALWVYTTAPILLEPAVDWYTATSGGAYISTGLGGAVSVPAGAWTLLAAVLTAPATTLGAVMRARHSGTPPSSSTWYATAITLVPVSTYTASPQTVTASSRAVNGVSKSHTAGEPVDVWNPAIAAL